MVYRNNEIPPPKKQDHTLAAVISTTFFIAFTIIWIGILISDMDLIWKIVLSIMVIWMLYGLYVNVKRALIGKDYCTECGRPFQA